MHFSLLNVIVCAVVLMGWLTVGSLWYLHARRHRQQHVEWKQLTTGLSDLNAELDLVWTAEYERIRRSQ